MGPCTAGEVKRGSYSSISRGRSGKHRHQLRCRAVKCGCQPGPGTADAHIPAGVSRSSCAACAGTDRAHERSARTPFLSALRGFLPSLLLVFLSRTSILKTGPQDFTFLDTGIGGHGSRIRPVGIPGIRDAADRAVLMRAMPQAWLLEE